MNIGIIDSTINKNWIAYGAKIVEEKNFAELHKEKKECEIHKHGTLVINTVQKYSKKKNRYYICNVMNDVQRGSSKAVLNALKYLQTVEGLQIIIMSLCISSLCNKREIDIRLKQLKRKGVIIFAAASNIEKGGYPAISPYVIGVGKDREIFDERIFFHKYAKIQVLANAYPEFISLGKGKYQIFMGSSKAVPMVVGTIIRLMHQKEYNKKDVICCLKQQGTKKSVRCLINKSKKEKRFIEYSTDSEWIWENIREFVREKYKSEFNYYENDFNMRITEITHDINDIYKLLEFISKKQKKIIDYDNITFNEFKTVGALYNYLTLCSRNEEI